MHGAVHFVMAWVEFDEQTTESVGYTPGCRDGGRDLGFVVEEARASRLGANKVLFPVWGVAIRERGICYARVVLLWTLGAANGGCRWAVR